MKILFVANSIVGDKPGVSGGESRMIEIAGAWAEKGYEIHLLSSPGAKYLCDQFGLRVKLHLITKSTAYGRRVYFARALLSIFNLPKSLFEERFDIVYSASEQIYDVMPPLILKRRSPSIRWATTVHWLPPFPPWKRTGSTWYNAIWFFISERLGLAVARRGADILLAVSDETVKQLAAIKIPSFRYQAVECGVDFPRISRVASSVKMKTREAVFMKRLQRVKGVFDLIDIWAKVVAKKPNAKLVVIGEGIDGKEAERRSQKLGLSKNIEFLGAIYDFEEKFRRIAEARLFLLPTHEENWAIVVGEAMAAGTPVLSYDLPELRSVWRAAAIFIKKHDLEAFAKKIVELLDNPEAQRAWRVKGLDYVSRYDWRKIAEKELETILKNGRRREAVVPAEVGS